MYKKIGIVVAAVAVVLCVFVPGTRLVLHGTGRSLFLSYFYVSVFFFLAAVTIESESELESIGNARGA